MNGHEGCADQLSGVSVLIFGLVICKLISVDSRMRAADFLEPDKQCRGVQNDCLGIRLAPSASPKKRVATENGTGRLIFRF